MTRKNDRAIYKGWILGGKNMAERTGTRESGIMANLENQDGVSVFVNLRTRGGMDMKALTFT